MDANIKIRLAKLEDGEQIGQLIFDTVHTINRKDYSQKQVEAWAPDCFIFSKYEESDAYVAELDGVIIGFGNITSVGYVNRFYIHKNFQRLGIGSLLLRALEERALILSIKEMTAEVSITAKAFFLEKGWKVQDQQTVILREESFINFKMSKQLNS